MKNPIEMLKEIKNLLGVELSEEVKEDPQIVLAQLKLDNGTVIEANDFVEGNDVFILTEDERVALPKGEYQLEDGRTLEIIDDGVINSVEVKAEEEPEEKLTTDGYIYMQGLSMLLEKSEAEGFRKKAGKQKAATIDAEELFEKIKLDIANYIKEVVDLKKEGINQLFKYLKSKGQLKQAVENEIGKKIVSAFNLKKQNQIEGYELSINSNKTTETISKDSTGKTLSFKTKINVLVSLKNKDKVFKEKNFVAEFVYNNIKSKFDLSQYQQDIEANLTETIIEEISIFLIID